MLTTSTFYFVSLSSIVCFSNNKNSIFDIHFRDKKIVFLSKTDI